ncbi:MAG TPA: SusC/RagA family TonB-linked outer membrane protein [Gemmatimonadaceae bacterium]|nr:SusC/RagA family TonB-linked outer membrane protein [Gemmatimonadaceae bacterium]
MGTLLLAAQAFAQQKAVTGKVTSEQGLPLGSVQITIKGTTTGTLSSSDGTYSIRAAEGQVLQFRLIGNAPAERTVGAADVINVELKAVATSLDAVVVTALGRTNVKRAVGTAQQQVSGAEIAQTNRESFVNALVGRVAGVEVTSSSGVPGASSVITIRGVSSISTNNQPLMIIDGLPLDNKTLSSGVLASDNPTSGIAFSNRFVDFTNRASDLNPEDIESLVVLKGPEASALYGIDAGNGAIVITTKRGRPGAGGFEYSNSFRMDNTGRYPKLQRIYGPTASLGTGSTDFTYWGLPYASGTQFYDNVDGFFRASLTQKHNLSFSGAAPDNRINYRVSVSEDKQQGVIPLSEYTRVTLMGATQGVVNSWLKADAALTYSYSTNNQPFKSGSSPGYAGPLIGLLIWPQTDDAQDWLTPAGQRRRLTLASASTESDNPYFSVNKNRVNAVNNRILTNVGFTLAPFSWSNLKTNIGVDAYTNNNLILRHPESAAGFANNGALDIADNFTRNISSQTLLNINAVQLPYGLSVSGVLGNAVNDYRDDTNAERGLNFMDPNFVSINNTDLTTRFSWNNLFRRRVVSAFGSATFDYKRYLYVTVTGRNDWTSTIPVGRNSFFYPSVNASFIFSDAFPSVARFVTGKLRAGWAEVGKDARPYSYRPALESKTTSYGGYGYGFTGPNPLLKPEFATSKEIGTELSFLDDRLSIDATWYRKETRDQIIQNARGSYGTGFVLMNLNGAKTRTQGWELTLGGTPYLKGDASWDIQANWTHVRAITVSLPSDLPEAYNSDTWLYGNIRNGTVPGQSLMSLTGTFYLRNKAGQLLIDPTSGLPLRSSGFIDRGYDRQPNWTMGLTNTFRYGKFSLNFLLHFRRGGDVFNATDHFLTVRGLAERTADREVPRVIAGVLRDGKENTATPTINNIVVIPAQQNAYYTGMSEELFIEKNINWVRLKDVTLRYQLPGKYLGAKDASVFITGTDLFLKTNYTGLDPIVNGNTAATGGSGGVGIDFGNFPMPKGVSFGLKVGY